MQSDRRHRILPGRSWCDHRSRLVPISRSSRISVSGFDCTQVSVLWVTYMSTDATRWKVQVPNDSRHCISPGRSWCDYRSCHVLISRLSKISASGRVRPADKCRFSESHTNQQLQQDEGDKCNMTADTAFHQRRRWCDHRSCLVPISRFSKISVGGLDVMTSVGPLIRTWMKSCNEMEKSVIWQKALHFTWKYFV